MRFWSRICRGAPSWEDDKTAGRVAVSQTLSPGSAAGAFQEHLRAAGALERRPGAPERSVSGKSMAVGQLAPGGRWGPQLAAMAKDKLGL